MAISLSMLTSGATILPNAPSDYITDCIEADDETVWIATEGDGVWTYTPGDTQWKKCDVVNFGPLCGNSYLTQHPDATQNKCDAHVYALYNDYYGNVWAGSAHSGVCITNKKQFLHISPENGFMGERVFDITGNHKYTAISTNKGIFLYNHKQQAWEMAPIPENLADNVAVSLAFDDKNRLWAAFACGGVGCINLSDDKWLMQQSPWYFDNSFARQPFQNSGRGLPGNLGNVIAFNNNTIYYGCTSGLAKKIHNSSWSFIRGKNYNTINKGLFRQQKLPKEKLPPGILSEDYVTAIFPDGDNIWVGFREKGIQKINATTLEPRQDAHTERFNKASRRELWIRSFMKRRNGQLYAATYGGGLRYITTLTPSSKVHNNNELFPALPQPPSKAELADLIATLEKYSGKDTPAATYLFDDWLTRGNWCHRYGNCRAILCAAAAPSNVSFSFGESAQSEDIGINAMLGPNRRKQDTLRHWLEKSNEDSNPNILWNPDAGTRTEAEWDDHGETYPQTQDGPDIWLVVKVPRGLWQLSLYFYNPNAHKGKNGYRDYLIEIRAYTGAEQLRKGNIENITAAELKKEVISRTRVFDFGGSGCWKNFALTQPGTYLVRICRNGSFNTIVNGVFLSDLSISPDQYRHAHNQAMPPPCTSFSNLTTASLPQQPLKLWSVAWKNRLITPTLSQRALRLALFSLSSSTPPAALYNRWQHLTHIHTAKEESLYNKSLLDAWYTVQDRYHYARSSFWRPHSPRVVPLTAEELRYADSNDIDWLQYLPNSSEAPIPSLKALKTSAKKEAKQ